MRFLYFKSWLDDFCIFNKCDLFVYEQAAHHKSNAATHVCHGLIATAEQVAAHRRIEITSKSPSELKKYATGKGNANKDLMLAAARKRWPDLELVDDNHADALHLLSMMISDLNLKNKFDVMYGY